MALQVWLPLNGNINNQGLSNAVITNNGAILSSNGKIGNTFHFTENGYCTLSSAIVPSESTDFSCAYWVKENSNNTVSSFRGVYNCGGFLIGQYGSKFDVYNTSGGCDVVALIDSTKWNHCCVTFSRDKVVRLYINGEFVKESSATSFPSSGTVSYIGRRVNSGTNQYNDMYLNDFRIYDHCLSAKEVSEIAKGLVLHYPLNGGEGGINLFKGTKEYYANASGKTTSGINLLYDTSILPLNDLIGKTITFTFDYSIEGDKLNTSGSWQVMRFGAHLTFQYVNSDGVGSIAYPCTQYLEHSGTGRAVQIYTIPSTWQSIKSFDISAGAYNQPAENNTNTWYMKNFKVELGNIDTGYSINPNTLGETPQIYDCSGFGNNGIKSGAIACESDSPRYMTSYKFNGNSCIKNNQFYFESPIWTVSLWYKYNTAPTAYEGLICLSKNDGFDSNKKIAIMTNSNYIWFKTENISMSIPSLKVGEWCHLAVVSDGTSAIIYENGVRKASTTISSFVTKAYDLVVGARASSAGATTTSVYNTGNISDVRIYATALPADAIKQLYNTPISVDKTGNLYAYEFKEG